MTLTRAYKLSLPLPYVVPGLVALVVWATGLSGHAPNGNIESALLVGNAFLERSVLVGAIPYGIVAVGILLWTRRGSLDSVRASLLAAPLWTVVAMADCVLLYHILHDAQGSRPPEAEILRSLGMYALGIVGLGYAYVALAFAFVEFLDLTAFVDGIEDDAIDSDHVTDLPTPIGGSARS